jgi:(p)ppGpp synthase/HD superfamily hydrolase
MADTADHHPDFVHRSPLLEQALEVARVAHVGDDGDASALEHPLAVGRLLSERAEEERLVAVGLLHDVLEDSTIGEDELRARFGDEIASLVARLTEDPRIEPYEARKRELRERIAAGGRDVAVVSLADKLDKARQAEASGRPVRARKLEHYERTLQALAAAYPDAPFVPELGEALSRLRAVVRG